MPDLVFRESEIVIKQNINTVYGNGNCYIGRTTANLITSGKFKGTLIVTEVSE